MEFANLSGTLAEAAGRTMLHSLWLGFFLLALMKLLLHSIPVRLSRLRYRVAGMTLMLFTVGTAMLFVQLCGPDAGIALPGVSGDFLAGTATFSGIDQKWLQAIPNSVWDLITRLYLIGILGMVVRSGFTLLSLAKMKQRCHQAGQEWSLRFEALSRKAGLMRKVRLMVSPHEDGPGVIGWLNPVVTVPAGMLMHMPAAQIETILLHELVHIKRLDHLVNLMQVVAETVFFYHPAVWNISRSMRREREHCCDDRVLSTGSPPLLYASALAQISMGGTATGRMVPAAGSTGHYLLYRRIQRILNQKQMKKDAKERVHAMVLILTGTALLVLLSGFSSGFSILKHRSEVPLLAQTGSPATVPVAENEHTGPSYMISADTIPPVPETNPALPVPETAEDNEFISGTEMEANIKTETEMDVEFDVDFDVDVEQEVKEALEEIDWEEIREEVERASREVRESIDWEEIREEVERSSREVHESIDWEEMQREIEISIKEIEWDKIRAEMEGFRISLDSLKRELARDPE